MLAIVLAFLVAAGSGKPPVTPARPVVDDYFGTKIVDPYRWLENGRDPQVQAWSHAQDSYTHAALGKLPGRAALRTELTKLFSIPTIDTPAPYGPYLFYSRRGPGQNQPVYLVRPAAGGAERVLVDPNKLSKDGTLAVDWSYPSADGKYVAYGTSLNGDEQSTLHVVETGTGRLLLDSITRMRAAAVAWLPDDSGFYYTRFADSATETNVDRRVYVHALAKNIDGEGDTMVYGSGLPQDHWASVDLSHDGRWLLLYASHGSENANDLEVRDLAHPSAEPIVINQGGNASWSGQVVGNSLYLLTNDAAPRNQFVEVDLENPVRGNWRTRIPQGTGVVDSAVVADGHIVATFLENASSRIRIYSLDGRLERELGLPGIGSVQGLGAQDNSPIVYYGFASFNVPFEIQRYDLSTSKGALWEREPVPFDPSRFVVKQVRYHSKDGTLVSMFLMYKRGLKLDGSAPAYLTGYGGFDINLTARFSFRALIWAQRGGVYAVPNLRGSGEYGERWHRAGMLANKQNVFDDFAWAAKWLIANKYTSSQKLAIQGGSNGGLLVAATEAQHPDLFRAVECDVPLTDMLRYQKFLIARLWVSEYGSSDDKSQFAYIAKYSPYQNIRTGAHYPATLVTTSKDDSRVDPMNARKLAARLQAANGGPYPIYLRVEAKTGHGAGRPISKIIEEQVDELSFLFHELGVADGP
jgi:prolyl oligopeptidase